MIFWGVVLLVIGAVALGGPNWDIVWPVLLVVFGGALLLSPFVGPRWRTWIWPGCCFLPLEWYRREGPTDEEEYPASRIRG